MYNHPEGQSHPRAPKHLKRLKRHSFGHDIHGKSLKKIKKFLIKEKVSFSDSLGAMANSLRNYIYHHKNREQYINFAKKELKSRKVNIEKTYDVALIGAGPHAAIYVYHLKKLNPKLKIIILEKDNIPCSTFYHLGDSLVLNSPTFSKVGLNSNIMQGHFIQTSDFDELEEKPFPTAKHLYQLTTMILFHADADILFDFNVKKIDTLNNINIVTNNKIEIRAKNVILSNGMGGPKVSSFKKDKKSSRIITGDAFLKRSFEKKNYFASIKNKKIAVIGAGDTANCVMEYLLPLVYPNYYYGFYRNDRFLPKYVYWVGQNAKNIQDYFFANKSRYCHSGGVIEFFWDKETPFELSTEVWKRTKELIECIPERLESTFHKQGYVNLKTKQKNVKVDMMIDCTGRTNKLSQKIMKNNYTYLKGDIALYGGQWDDRIGRFTSLPRKLKDRKIACQVENKNIFLIGSSCNLSEMIEDDEAKNGSLKYQEERKSLTNSKWSLEHTLPRTVSFAINHLDFLDL